MKDYILKIKNEAHNWENASPIGAGSIGAMLYGGIAEERISYNEETVWDGEEMDTFVPDYREKLETIRQYFLDGKLYEGEKWAYDNFDENFFEIKSYEAAGELLINMHRDGECSGYERFIDLKRGIFTVSYEKYGKKYFRESFASHPARLVCTHMTCDPDMKGAVSFARENIKKCEISIHGQEATMNYVCATASSGNLFKFTVKLVTDGVFERMDETVGYVGASNLYIYVSVVTAFRDPSLDTMKYISEASRGYDELKREHIDDFSAIMNRSDIAIGEENKEIDNMSVGARLKRLTVDSSAEDPGMIGLYFQFGKYLLVSSSREDTYPANLQGLWSDGIEAPWNADYHTNINLQMNYWPSDVANIQETADALFSYMNDNLLPGGRRVARENYKAGGAVVHHVADIYKFAAAADGMWGLWPLGGAWLAYHMWERYLFTGDKNFLRNTAYEFIRDSAVFFMDTMFEGKNGEILSGPSTSPENSYLVDVDGKKKYVFLTLSPTMDIQIIGGLLDFYAECEDILGIDPDGAAKARSIRSKMPKMKVGRFGQLQEWIEDYEEFEPGHRHISHAFGLYPSAQITRKTPEYFAAIKTTLDRRLSFGGGHTGWSRAWLISLFSRLKNGEEAYKNLRALWTNSTLYNMFDNHPPFQIDGNFGGCAGIAEMVMQSHEGFISLLPAISREMNDGYFENLLARGGYTVSAQWSDGKIKELTVIGDGEALIELPEVQSESVLIDDQGRKYNADCRMVKIPCGKYYFS